MARVFVSFAVGVFASLGCQGPKEPAFEEVAVSKKLNVSSTTFRDGQPIPMQYTAYGHNLPPTLSWTEAPQEAKSVLLVLDDPDAVRNPPFIHWMVANLPVQGSLGDGKVPAGAIQGKNDHGDIGYFGPRPPSGSGTHHYRFHAYALDSKLNLPQGFNRAEVQEAMKGHVVAEGVLTGLYESK